MENMEKAEGLKDMLVRPGSARTSRTSRTGRAGRSGRTQLAAQIRQRRAPLLLDYCPVFHAGQLPSEALDQLLAAASSSDSSSGSLPGSSSEPPLPIVIAWRQARLHRRWRELVELFWCRAADLHGLPHEGAICMPLLARLAQQTAALRTQHPEYSLEQYWIALLEEAASQQPTLWLQELIRQGRGDWPEGQAGGTEHSNNATRTHSRSPDQ
jgi:hypothetical protein